MEQFHDILIISIIVIVLVVLLSALVIWARKGNKGANLIAATFTFFPRIRYFRKTIKPSRKLKTELRKTRMSQENLLLIRRKIIKQHEKD
ncbi:hypothetical protein KJ966_22505 [bacterium]|nr:hypothetical protein [bacterium]